MSIILLFLISCLPPSLHPSLPPQILTANVISSDRFDMLQLMATLMGNYCATMITSDPLTSAEIKCRPWLSGYLFYANLNTNQHLPGSIYNCKFSCTYIHTHTHTYIHTHKHTHTHTYIHTHTYTYTHIQLMKRFKNY